MSTLEEIPTAGASDNTGTQVYEEHGFRLSATMSRRKTVSRMNLVLEGEVSLKNVNFLAKHLQGMLHNYEYLNIQLKNISDFDLPSLQLMWHLKRNAQNQGKTVAVVSQLSPETMQLFKTAGLNKVISDK
jgi:ABC-type transporter Mla MlaB component